MEPPYVDKITEERLQDVEPALVVAFRYIDAEFRHHFRDWIPAKGPFWFLRVTRGLASTAEQVALYAQGRERVTTVNALRHAAGLAPIAERENEIVTQRDGIKKRSAHQGRTLARAIDVVPMADPDGPAPLKAAPSWASVEKWRVIGELAHARGLIWGGDWEMKDLPHLELPETAREQIQAERR